MSNTYLGDAFFNYSLEERVVGSWLGLKPVYEKTIYIDYLVLGSRNNYWYTEYDISNLDIETNISIKGTFFDELMNDRYDLPLANNLYCQFNKEKLYFISNINFSYPNLHRLKDFYITLQYTKNREEEPPVQTSLQQAILETNFPTLNTQSKNLVGAVNETFQSVSNGKTLIASAITDKGVQTSSTDTFNTMAAHIRDIPTGGSEMLGGYAVPRYRFSGACGVGGYVTFEE